MDQKRDMKEKRIQDEELVKASGGTTAGGWEKTGEISYSSHDWGKRKNEIGNALDPDNQVGERMGIVTGFDVDA